MGFPPPTGVPRRPRARLAAPLVRSLAIAAGLALVWSAAHPIAVCAETIPGPPLDAAPDRGAHCLLRGGAAATGTGFATAVAAIALAARRRGARC